MPKNVQKNIKGSSSKKKTSPWKNILLALTLVPMVIGIILIGAWALDFDLLGGPQAQITVGIFFFLLTFTASNAIQTRWRLAAGWGALAIADIVTLAWLNVAAQIIAVIVGLIGVVLLGIEFYKQYQQGKPKKKK
jgi:membrane-bound ClpP family serine protease